MTEDEIQTLAQLLRKLAAEGLGTPRAPKEVFLALKGVVVQPTVEILATRSGRDVLLTRRDDKHWNDYHLPGGFVGVGERLEDACDRIARAELGTGARFERLVGHYSWTEHPYATPLSLLCLCRLDAAPRAGEYFDPLPPGLLREHRELLERFRVE